MPKTSLGRWSVGFIGAFIIFLVTNIVLIASGQRRGETFFSYPVLAISMLLAVTSDVLAFLTGLIGVIRNRERSILVFLAMLIGFFVLLFVLVDIIVPD